MGFWLSKIWTDALQLFIYSDKNLSLISQNLSGGQSVDNGISISVVLTKIQRNIELTVKNVLLQKQTFMSKVLM